MNKKSLSKYKKEADRLFSLYIRHRDNGVCFTCGKKDEIKKVDAGHYISRHYLATRFDEKNVHVQCKACNIFKKGNMAEYAIRLQRKYGTGILEELDKRKHEQVKFCRFDYELMIDLYKNKLKEMGVI